MRRLFRNEVDNRGAVAPIVALALFALIGAGGVAYDYARLASLDTELQNAADQAALAAATQLDGQAGALARATAAAQSMITNQTRFAANASTPNITVPTLTFYKGYNSATDAFGAVTTVDAEARVVQVQVGSRTANFALTPIINALSSATVSAEAVAGMSSAICKQPPMMMCNPTDGTYNLNNLVGRGVRLKGSGTLSPGNFGFLDVGAGASDLAKVMGWSTSTFECADVTNPSTKPGNIEAVVNEFNTRFDLYESGDSIGCFGESKCAPSLNSRKDVVISHVAPYTKNNCGVVNPGGNGWSISSSPYRPTTSALLPTGTTPDVMGYPHDRCHAYNNAGNCTAVATWASKASGHERIGTGDWDIDAYWRANHPADVVSGLYPTSMNATIMAVSPLPAGVIRDYPTRYQVYRWEMLNAATRLTAKTIGTTYNHGQPVCRPGLAASTPGASNPDRRVLPVAVVNCAGLGGGVEKINPLDTVDVFLTEPSVKRETGSGPSKVTYSDVGDFYVEVIGHTGQGTGNTANQFVRRDKPYLIR